MSEQPDMEGHGRPSAGVRDRLLAAVLDEPFPELVHPRNILL